MRFASMRLVLLFQLVCLTPTLARDIPELPSLRKQAEIRQAWLRERLETVLPRLMRENNVDMWIVQMSEYNEDPVFRALVSPTRFAARRRSIFVFYDRGEDEGVERLALGGGDQGGVYTAVEDPEDSSREIYLDVQWRLLRLLIEEREPKTIAINVSRTHAFSDGLASGERELLEKAVGPKWSSRFVSAELLPLHYLAIRTPSMTPHYTRMMEVAHALLATALSSEVITPGATTNTDVVWWLRQQVHDRAMDSWFQPSVDVQRHGEKLEGDVVIQRGDVLHTDFGIYTLGLATDTQHMGYVLREGETSVPAGLMKALENANRLQDIVMANMKPGLTGNKVLAESLAQMRKTGLSGRIYNHPIGDHGHGAGPLVGLWDRQEGVPGRGDVRLIPNMWHSIELYAETSVPEWDDQIVRIALDLKQAH